VHQLAALPPVAVPRLSLSHLFARSPAILYCWLLPYLHLPAKLSLAAGVSGEQPMRYRPLRHIVLARHQLTTCLQSTETKRTRYIKHQRLICSHAGRTPAHAARLYSFHVGFVGCVWCGLITPSVRTESPVEIYTFWFCIVNDKSFAIWMGQR
jgi:hypothetical protein